MTGTVKGEGTIVGLPDFDINKNNDIPKSFGHLQSTFYRVIFSFGD